MPLLDGPTAPFYDQVGRQGAAGVRFRRCVVREVIVRFEDTAGPPDGGADPRGQVIPVRSGGHAIRFDGWLHLLSLLEALSLGDLSDPPAPLPRP